MKYRIIERYIAFNNTNMNTTYDMVNIPHGSICITVKEIDHEYKVTWLEPVEDVKCL